MKRFFLCCALLAPALLGSSPQLAFIVLNAADWAAGKLPPDWQVKVNRGKPEFSIRPEHDGPALHLKSAKSSFGLERKVDVDPAEMPYLAWRWKVVQLPAGGDFRKARTDDQAAQLLVAFADRRVISYIWDTTAPRGTAQRSGYIPFVNVFAIVCQSGADELNRWIDEVHDVAADYQRAYSRPAPRVRGLRIQINSQHTGTSAESYFRDVAFRAKTH